MRRRRKYSAGEAARKKHSWLELVQQSGPFLTLPVVDRVFPDGLPEVQSTVRTVTRAGIADMFDNAGATRRGVIERILTDALDWAGHLRQGHDLPAALAEPVPEYGTRIAPDFGFYVSDAETTLSGVADDDEDEGDEDADTESTDVVEDLGPWRLFGTIVPWGDHPLTRTTENGWTASPVERLAHLLRARGVPIGLVTDGRWWSLVWAPIGGTTAAAVWDAGLWSEEPESFQAFIALLTRARFLAVAKDDTLPSLFVESLAAQEEVTETLGRQVRDAVELLIATLDRLDAESGDRILDGVSDDELYDGVVTVMMRIVFLLFAEERRLLPSDDHLYVASYSVGRLVDQLEEQAAVAGEQTLEYRTGAWHRLLAVARALHSGVAHEDLRLPAYGGGLFDPNRYPWLEGRVANDNNQAAVPPSVDDRTVLRMLRAVQYVDINGERRRLTFRALDVEQIGYVYEGLLELEVRTATEVVLGFVRPAKWPKGKKEDACEIPLSEVAIWLAEPHDRLALRLKARTGWTASKVEQTLRRILDANDRAQILNAVGGDSSITQEILKVAAVLRYDERGYPAITMPGRRYIGPSTRRAATGTHYTPRSLAEDVVNNTLEPLVYRPGPLQTANRAAWQICASSEILKLRVADIAMGSGAFLVAACRYLADRLIEAWLAEGRHNAILAERRRAGGTGPIDAEVEQLALDARRLVAEHCLYGVDINPLAVEMAKLSLWLVTMDRERPFGFLDDRFVCGDALIGLASLEQLETLHLDPVAGRRLAEGTLEYSETWRDRLAEAAVLRSRITAQPVTTIRDVEFKSNLLKQSQVISETLRNVADAITGVGMLTTNSTQVANQFTSLRLAVMQNENQIGLKFSRPLQNDRPEHSAIRLPLHFPLVFPEVFTDKDHPGFDAIIGNPPFLSGKRISGSLGKSYLAWLQRWNGRALKGSVDLSARFLLRAEELTNDDSGQIGLIATNTLVQGDTLEVGLMQVVARGSTLRRAVSSHPWPSRSAALEIVEVWLSRARLSAQGSVWLDGEEVPAIGIGLEPAGRIVGRPHQLAENAKLAFVGSYVLGLGFTMTPDDAEMLILKNQRNAQALKPYVVGQDVNQRPDSSASRWVINFRDWSLEKSEEYPDLMSVVRREVKPERDLKKRDAHRRFWWKYADYRAGLNEALASLQHAQVLGRISPTALPVRLNTDAIFAESTVVIADGSYSMFAILSSCVHFTWILRYGGTLGGSTVVYAPSDIFQTLPRPRPSSELESLGMRLELYRRDLMLARSWGMTATYNRVHNPTDGDPAIKTLRELHADLDVAVVRAFGWGDLDLEVGHHPTKLGIRWTIKRDARFELLDRLLEENHRRYEAQK